MVKSGIGAAVLVRQCFPVIHGQNSRNRPILGEGDPNTDIVPHVRGEIVKPFEWLRWKMFAQSRCHDKIIK